MSIKLKVLLLSILGPTLLAILVFAYAMQSIWKSEEEAVLQSARGIVSMTLSAPSDWLTAAVAPLEKIGRAVQQECRDRYRMPSSA